MSAEREESNQLVQTPNQIPVAQASTSVNPKRRIYVQLSPSPIVAQQSNVNQPQNNMSNNNGTAAAATNMNPSIITIPNPMNNAPNTLYTQVQVIRPPQTQPTALPASKGSNVVCIATPSPTIPAVAGQTSPASAYPGALSQTRKSTFTDTNQPTPSQYPGTSSQTRTNTFSAPVAKNSTSTGSGSAASGYPGASSTTRGVSVGNKTERTTCCTKCRSCVIGILCCIITGVGLSAYVFLEQYLGIDLECFEDPIAAGLPLAGEGFEFCQNGILQKISVNKKTKYFKPELTLRCVMEIDDDGDLDSDASYIEISDDYPDTLEVDDVLLATADIFQDIHRNCTRFPAVIITEISDDSNGIVTLRIREADMFEYIDELDVNIANASTYDSGIDMGEIKRLKKMMEYLNNRSAIEAGYALGESVAFQNVNYTQMKSECYKVYEDGTEEKVPIIGGMCGDLSEVNYFGQQYGIDTVQFGSQSFADKDDTYGVEVIDTERRRLFLKKWWRKIKKKVVKVVEDVVEIVEDIIEALSGNIEMRVYEKAISIGPSDTFTIAGEAVKTSIEKEIGNFRLNAGVDFYTGIYVDLEAKYQIIGDGGPSFDSFRLIFGGETRFRAYAEIGVNGEVTIEYEIARREKRTTFYIGIIPVVVKPYASVSLGLTSDTPLPFNSVAEFGYEPIKIEFGVEWVKGRGFSEYSKGFDGFVPYKNLGLKMDNQLCTGLEIKPYIKLQMGVVFYDAVDIFVAAKLSLISEFASPEACHKNRCGDDMLQTYFGLSLGFSFSIGYDIDASGIGLGRAGDEFELFALETKPIFEDCLNYNISSNTLQRYTDGLRADNDYDECELYCAVLYSAT